MPKTNPRQGLKKPVFVRWILAAILLAVGGLFLFLRQTSESTDELLQNARKAWQRSQFEQAEQFARRVLNRDHVNAEARWIAGRSCASLKRYSEAVEELSLIDLEGPMGMDAKLLAAQLLHNNLYLFDEAETAYRTVLQRDATNLKANDGIARLLAVCGRRSEAMPMILQLVKQEQASDLLIVLARESGAINDEELLERAHQAAPESAGPVLGLARLADLRQQTDEAAELCRQAVQQSPNFVPAHIELGRYLLQLNQYEALNVWQEKLPPNAASSAEIQKVLGFIEIHHGRSNEALSAFLKAAQSAPDSRDVCYQISRLLFAAGDSAAAEVYVKQLDNIRRLHEAQDRVLFFAEQPDADSLLEMIAAYERCGRLLEAYGWTQMAVDRFPENAFLQQLLQRLTTETETLDPVLVPTTANPAMKIAGNNYVFPETTAPESAESPNSKRSGNPGTGISFSEASEELGLSFHYENGGTLRRRMFEFNGGGVGAEDLDRDGYSDIIFSQGGNWELRGTPDNSQDVLFRNVRGKAFEDISQLASFGGTEYGQGVAIGDIDQDGFPDILVAGIGGARLWMNLGDGTFRDEGPLPITDTSADPWLTSCAIADLNRDALPDIYITGYLSGSDVFDRVCRDSEGAPEACLPTVFRGEADQFFLNDGSGSFLNASNNLPISSSEGKGLGVLIYDPAGHCRPSVYVANDTTPNALSSIDPDSGIWDDTAFASGVAVSGLGKSEGSMGIAMGDPNLDGVPDLVVTNFLYEAFAFYQGLGNSLYRDERLPSGLQESTYSVLGFGTQFLDANLDGELELFIANGHIDNLSTRGKPWKMPAQLFTFHNGRFQLIPAENSGPWFQVNHLGRAAVSTDWNADGRPDLIVGNLKEPSVVLTNTSRPCGTSLRLRLVASGSSREAVCASVVCRTGSLVQTQQITAGDGYQCSNDKQLLFGCGSASIVDELQIRWPSGTVQVFSDLSVTSEWIVVEGRSSPLIFPR